MKYSLADYIMTITIPEKLRGIYGFTSISIGGEGSYLGNFSASQSNDTWSTKGDATGSWVHSKSLSRVGTASLTLNMLSPKIVELTKLFNFYFNSNVIDEGVQITISDANSRTVVDCTDCYITRIPVIDLSETPGDRNWSFTCGRIIFS